MEKREKKILIIVSSIVLVIVIAFIVLITMQNKKRMIKVETINPDNSEKYNTQQKCESGDSGDGTIGPEYSTPEGQKHGVWLQDEEHYGCYCPPGYYGLYPSCSSCPPGAKCDGIEHYCCPDGWASVAHSSNCYECREGLCYLWESPYVNDVGVHAGYRDYVASETSPGDGWTKLGLADTNGKNWGDNYCSARVMVQTYCCVNRTSANGNEYLDNQTSCTGDWEVYNGDKCSEDEACYVTGSGNSTEYHWGKFADRTEYDKKTNINSNGKCGACWVNSATNSYQWDTKQPATGYSIKTSITSSESCVAPQVEDKTGCYLYMGQDYYWGDYDGQNGYFYISDDIKTCNRISISKVNENGDSLPDAVISFNNRSYTIGTTRVENLGVGSYTISETQEPNGYKKMDGDITVTVNNNGEITISGSNIYQSTNGRNAELKIKNEKEVVEEQPACYKKNGNYYWGKYDGQNDYDFVSENQATCNKIDIIKVNSNGQTITGATITVDGTSYNVGTYTATGLANGTHTIIETNAPSGYQLDNTTITITVSSSGEITITDASNVYSKTNGRNAELKIKNENEVVEEQPACYVYNGNYYWGKYESQVVNGYVKMPIEQAKCNQITINKVTDSGTIISGAKITIDGNEKDVGTYIETKLSQGTHTIIETEAPSRYQLDSSPITVTVSSEGIITINGGSNIYSKTEGNNAILNIQNILVPEEDACYIYNNNYYWGKYEGQNGYNFVSKNQATCNKIQVIKVDGNNTKISNATINFDGVEALIGEKTYENLTVGNHRIVEINAPEGYILDSSDITITVSSDGTLSISGGNNISSSGSGLDGRNGIIYIKNEAIPQAEDACYEYNNLYYWGNFDDQDGYEYVSKNQTTCNSLTIVKVNGNGAYLSNAIIDFDGVEDTFGSKTYERLTSGVHQITEINAPSGYQLDNSLITATVNADGSIKINGGSNVYEAVDGRNATLKIKNELVEEEPACYMKDEKYYWGKYEGQSEYNYISKNQATCNTLEIIKVDENGRNILNASINFDNKSATIGKVSYERLAVGRHTVVETAAPTGYLLDETEIIITVSSTGIISISSSDNIFEATSGDNGRNATLKIKNSTIPNVDDACYIKNDTGDYYWSSDLNSDEYTKVSASRNECNKLVIKKVDMNGHELAGAELKFDTEEIIAGVKTYTNIFTGNHSIVETSAPNGYQLDDTPISITVKQDGTISIANSDNIYSKREGRNATVEIKNNPIPKCYINKTGEENEYQESITNPGEGWEEYSGECSKVRACYRKGDDYYVGDYQERDDYEFVSADTTNCQNQTVPVPKTDKYSSLVIISIVLFGLGIGMVYYFKNKKNY